MTHFGIIKPNLISKGFLKYKDLGYNNSLLFGVNSWSELCLFNLQAEYIMRNAGLDEAQAGIKIAGRNVSHLRYADETTLMAECEE